MVNFLVMDNEFDVVLWGQAGNNNGKVHFGEVSGLRLVRFG